ncbi:MAG: 3-dehydroquinate synthase, partial [Bacteroidetes bacterium]|nr:3-dehydroquinate synthase [Bacteroidota bacterium]
MKFLQNPTLSLGLKSLESINTTIISDIYSSVNVLVDENTQKHCIPILKKYIEINEIFSVKSGEKNKSIYTCIEIWEQLSTANIDRKALLINLGGGVLCDMGGLIASTYKRGIDFINIPTTILSMCDAGIGGKLAVNINGLKNEIGLFNNPIATIIYPDFIKTLPERHKLSGFAEIIKHALIGDNKLFYKLASINSIYDDIEKHISISLKIKKRIVKLDPFEKNIRKALNFGHSIGHALEAFSLESKGEDYIYHGEAIAAGMIAESYISYIRKFISKTELDKITKF